MNHISQEIRILNCVAELIESSVNYVVCSFGAKRCGIVTGVLPMGTIEKNYFFILLLELFSSVNAEMVPEKDIGDNLLTLLRKVSEKPSLNTVQSNTARLNHRVSEFLSWLDHEFDYSIYSQEIGKNVTVTISRREALYLVGNRCKHTLVRSNIVLSKLVKKYREAGIDVLADEEALVLADIDNWFFDDFCGYHFTKLCELCSNLYHSIIEYVRPVYEKAIRFKDGMPASYEVPTELSRSDLKSEFYSLMNKVSNPSIPAIMTPNVLTLRY
jgi:hypothetical protein